MRLVTLGAALAFLALAPAHGADAPRARKAPGWTLGGADGRRVSMSDFRGRVVLLSFWAPAYPPCIAEIPANIELQRRYGPEGLAVVGVYVDTKSPAAVRAFMASHGINYAVVMADEKIKEDYGATDGYPTTFLIDRQGMIRFSKLGRRPPTFERDIAALLGAPAP
ncbi:MAG TPA: TlpA disulfide reductase family protein [Opitutaceae bacterium]|jgi:peroxiredoxin